MEKIEFIGSLLFRPMMVEDLEQVCHIEQQTFSVPWSRESFSESMELAHTLYYVAEYCKAREILGYCGLYQSLSEADITNVAVKKEFRNQQIGRQLLEALMKEGNKRRIERYTLEVRKSNQAAIRLYEKLGFTSYGIRKDYYEKPRENALIMSKIQRITTVQDKVEQL